MRLSNGDNPVSEILQSSHVVGAVYLSGAGVGLGVVGPVPGSCSYWAGAVTEVVTVNQFLCGGGAFYPSVVEVDDMCVACMVIKDRNAASFVV